MLTGIFNNGQMVSNPNLAPSDSVEVHQVKSGEFEVRYSEEVIGTSKDIEEANAIAKAVSHELS